jgi:alpha-glucosidase
MSDPVDGGFLEGGAMTTRSGVEPARRRILPLVAVAIGALVAAVVVTGPVARAQETTWTVSAPSSSGVHADLHYDAGSGTVELSVRHGGTTVVEPSPVGIVTEQADLSTGLEFVHRSDRGVVEQYSTTVGKQLDRRAVMKESVFTFEGDGGAQLDLVVRASADGVAYRYRLPADYGSVTDEVSAFLVPADASAWLARWRRDYENPFIEFSRADAPTTGHNFQVPALFEKDGSYLLLAESDLDGHYTGPELIHDGTGRYDLEWAWDDTVEVAGPLTTPWRVMIVGDLATVTESTLVDDLASESRVDDTSWIEPDQVLWTWIAGGRTAGRSLERQKQFVDYAAERGWPYVKVDAGWYFLPGDDGWDVTDPDWETNSWMPDLIEYAEARGVEIMVWLHYRDLATEDLWNDWLPVLHEWGVRGVKIDFMDSESQEMLRWYDEILPVLAENELMVNFHGSNIPKGIHRTWPHVMTMEGVHGAEKGANVTMPHLTTLPFTRNVIGSMDYTPGAFHRDNRPTVNADAHELALTVLFESGLQNLAGTEASYDARPEARRFLEQVPSVWDSTRLLSGRPGNHVVMARQSGDRWFIGAGVSGAGRTLEVPLDFLRGRWLVEVIRDDGAGGLLRKPHVVTGPSGSLSVDVVDGGGFAAIACRWNSRVTTCDQPVDRAEIPLGASKG